MRTTVVAIVALFALLPSFALAEGEAGLVVEWGDGTVSAFCIGFDGDSISGDRLLAEAGLVASDFTGLVCSINSVGCQHSGTFDSCTCECAVGSDSCVYWAFFTQSHGESWRYSALGFRSQAARDGDLHGWRWGERSSNSATAPRNITFEHVCGHPPGQAAPEPTATPVPPAPTLPASTIPPTAAATATEVTATTTAVATNESVITPTAATTTTRAASTGTTSPSSAATSTPEPLETVAPPTPAPPAAGDGGASTGGFIAFGVIAAVLLAGLGGALVWRQRRGA
jgi:MYXO-CTERM domain-containing protein